MINLAAIVVLLALNGFFVAAEFALVKARGLRLDNLTAENSAAARLTIRIQANLEAYLATCQLGITMASLGLGWAGEPAVAAVLKPMFAAVGVPDAILHTSAFLLGFLFFSALHSVIGEQVPKTFAIRRAGQVSMWVAYPLHCAYVLLWPLNWLLNNASRGILSLIKVEAATPDDVISDDEIKNIVSSSENQGSSEANETGILHNLLEFDRRSVGHIMLPRDLVKVLDVANSAEANQRVIMQFGYSRFPLIDSKNNDLLLGVVLAKVVYRAMIDQDLALWQRLEDYCQAPLIVLENQNVALLFELMRARREDFTLVGDEYGSLCGIVTLQDLLGEIFDDNENNTDAVHPAA